jgi:hypothetical protein
MRPIPPSLFRAFLLTLPLALSGCGIPDLVAHGVKTVENRQQAARPAPARPAGDAQTGRDDPPAPKPAPQPVVLAQPLPPP